jgi:hypothetical protein
MDDAPEHPVKRIRREATDAMFAGDWASVAEFFSDEPVKYDRRLLGTAPVSGRDQRLAELQVSFDTFPVKEWHSELLASRGARLALERVRFVSEQDYVYEFLGLTQLDERGRVALSIDFDVDDTETAMAELDDLASSIDGDA